MGRGRAVFADALDLPEDPEAAPQITAKAS